MTTILQPGDKIHLGIPVGELEPVQAQAHADYVRNQLAPHYKALGVDIAIWSSSGGFGCPHVVAVFRTPAVVPAGQHETEEQ